MTENLTLVSLFWGVISLGAALLTAKFLATMFPPSVPKEKRLGSIDGLRGLLALGVFLHHCFVTYFFRLTGVWTWTPYRLFNLTAQISVALFFAISGFLFTRRLFLKQGKINWRQLYISRIFRIFPLYWFAVLIILFIVIHESHYGFKISPLAVLSQTVTWLTLYGQPDINGFIDTWHICAAVFWTLKYEWLFYLSLPLLAFVIQLSKKSAWPLWIISGCVFVLAYLDLPVGHLGFSTFSLKFFLIGGICAAAYGIERYQTLAKKRFFFSFQSQRSFYCTSVSARLPEQYRHYCYSSFSSPSL